jgi:hypothetical protein
MVPRLPQPLDKLLDRDIRLPKDRAQRSAIQLLVIGYNDLGKGFIPPQDDVAGRADDGCESLLASARPRRHAREFRHTATTSVSNVSLGTGRWSSSRAAMYSLIASRAFATASSRV